MPTLRTPLMVAVLATLLVAGCHRTTDSLQTTTPPASEAPDGDSGGGVTPLVESEMSHAEAIRIAAAERPELHPIKVESFPARADTFTVTLLGADELVYIEVVGQSARVLQEQTKHLTAEAAGELQPLHAALMEGKASLERVSKIVYENYNPSVVREVEFEFRGEQLVAEVELRANNEVAEWVVDPETGDITPSSGPDVGADTRPGETT